MAGAILLETERGPVCYARPPLYPVVPTILRTTLLSVAAVLATACGSDERPGDRQAAPPADGAGGAARVIAPRNGRPRRALLIGVGAYGRDDGSALAAGELRDLPGPIHDVRLVRRLLLEQCGFEGSEILVLEDERATLEAVVSAMRHHLVDGVHADTEVLVWFSGHGSTTVDFSGREAGGDGSWVLYDSRVDGARGERDLDDDAIYSLLRACPSEFITVVTDCCHSGDITRSVEPYPSRGVAPADGNARLAGPAAPGWGFWPGDVAFMDDDDDRRDAGGWIHIAACRSQERAYAIDRCVDALYPGRPIGALTYAVVTAIRQARPGASWRSVVGRAKNIVRAERPVQTVVATGPLDRSLFSGAHQAHRRGHRAAAMPDGRIAIEAGVFSALAVGARIEVRNLDSDATMGWCVIEKCGVTRSVARWESRVGDVTADTPLQALLPDDGGAVAELRVLALALAPDAGEAREWLDGVGCIECVAAPDASEPVYRVVATERGWQLVAPDGFVVWPREGFRSDRKGLAWASRSEAEFWWLWNMGGQAGRGGIELNLWAEGRAFPAHGLVAAEIEAEGQTAGAVRMPRADEPEVGFDVMVSVKPASHVLVLDLDRLRRSVECIYPNQEGVAEAEAEGRWRAASRKLIPSVVGQLQPGDSFNRFLALASDGVIDMRPWLSLGRATGGRDAWRQLPSFTWGVAKYDLLLKR